MSSVKSDILSHLTITRERKKEEEKDHTKYLNSRPLSPKDH